MNATTHAALILDQQRAADLERRNAILRSRAARPAETPAPRSSGVAFRWFGKSARPTFRAAH